MSVSVYTPLGFSFSSCLSFFSSFLYVSIAAAPYRVQQHIIFAHNSSCVTVQGGTAKMITVFLCCCGTTQGATAKSNLYHIKCRCGTTQGATAKSNLYHIKCHCGTTQGATAKCYPDSFSTNRVVKTKSTLLVYIVFISLLVVGIKKIL
jgi:hypothetical protein